MKVRPSTRPVHQAVGDQVHHAGRHGLRLPGAGAGDDEQRLERRLDDRDLLGGRPGAPRAGRCPRGPPSRAHHPSLGLRRAGPRHGARAAQVVAGRATRRAAHRLGDVLEEVPGPGRSSSERHLVRGARGWWCRRRRAPPRPPGASRDLVERTRGDRLLVGAELRVPRRSSGDRSAARLEVHHAQRGPPSPVHRSSRSTFPRSRPGPPGRRTAPPPRAAPGAAQVGGELPTIASARRLAAATQPSGARARPTAVGSARAPPRSAGSAAAMACTSVPRDCSPESPPCRPPPRGPTAGRTWTRLELRRRQRHQLSGGHSGSVVDSARAPYHWPGGPRPHPRRPAGRAAPAAGRPRRRPPPRRAAARRRRAGPGRRARRQRGSSRPRRPVPGPRGR